MNKYVVYFRNWNDKLSRWEDWKMDEVFSKATLADFHIRDSIEFDQKRGIKREYKAEWK